MFLKSLFAGEIHEKLVFPFPKLKKEEEETLRLVLESLRRFAEENQEEQKPGDPQRGYPAVAGRRSLVPQRSFHFAQTVLSVAISGASAGSHGSAPT